MRALERLVALLLRCHRDPFGPLQPDDVLELFRARAAAARQRGRWASGRFLVRELAAFALAAAAEPVRPLLRTPRVFARELRHAARRLASAPTFTAAAVGTVALTLAALAVVFTLVHRIVLSPLPYLEADRLIDLDHGAPGVGIAADLGMSIGLYHQYGKLPSIESLALYYVGERTLAAAGDAENAEFLHATPSLARVLRVQPALGRWFNDEEATPGPRRVIILTDGFWRRRFGGDLSVIGRTIRVDGVPHEIVGVMPRGFAFPDPRVEFIAPLPLPAHVSRAAGFNYEGVARLSPGATVEAALAQQSAVIADLPRRYTADPEIASGLLAKSGLAARPEPMKARIVGRIAGTLWILLGACAIVMLMACANLANLFFVRAEAQRDELVLRRALGADGLALGAYHVAEAGLITAAAAFAGLLLAAGGIDVLVTSRFVSLPRLHEVRPGGELALFVLVAAVAVWLMISISPLLQAWIASRGPLHVRQRRATASSRALRVRQVLIAGQVALALVLTASAGLLGRSFVHLVRADPGFRSESRLVFRIGLPGSTFRQAAHAAAWHQGMLERVQGIPAVRGAATASTIPLTAEGQRDPIEVHGRPSDTSSLPVVRFTRVSETFFSTLDIRLRAGRLLDPADHRGAADSVVVNETLARQYFGGSSPLGQRIRPHGQRGDRWLTIVGVVADTATLSVKEREPLARLYVPLGGSLWADVPSPHEMTYVVHTDGSPLAAAPLIRDLLRQRNHELSLAGVERYDDVVARSREDLSFATVLIAIAAGVALLLGVVGVYAVIAYTVVQRRTEIAVRLAVGATPGQVTRQQLWHGAPPIAAGLLAGGVGTALASRWLEALLFGVSAHDPATYTTAGVVLFSIATLACWWPARRAALASPLAALRG